MRDLYSSHAAALRDALRHSVERGAMPSLGVLHQSAPLAATLTGTDATAQAPRIRRQLDRLGALPRALLVLAYAPRTIKRSCGSRCCASTYPAPEWEQAMRVALSHVAPLLAGRAANERLYLALITNALLRTHETGTCLAERCSVNRDTVAAHAVIIETDLIGNRQAPGRFDAASTRIDALLHEAGTWPTHKRRNAHTGGVMACFSVRAMTRCW